MKNTLLSSLALAIVTAGALTTGAVAQTNVFVDINKTWSGYMAVFNNAGGATGSKGGAVFDTVWGFADLKFTLDTGASTLTLQPNYNTYANALTGDNEARAFWTDSTDGGVTAGPKGNKWMEANGYIEQTGWAGGSVTFEGSILSSAMLSPNYTVSAFVKSFDTNNAWVGWSQDLISNGDTNFAVTFNAPAGKFQYGFLVEGLNANPDDSGAFGSVVVEAVPEPSTYALLALGAAGLGAHLIRRRRR